MELEELIIDNDPLVKDPEKLSRSQIYFKKGEWKKGLYYSAKLFNSTSTPIQNLIETYKAGCQLACKIIEASNIKLGIQITKKLNKLLPSDKTEQFIQYQCEVLNYITCAYKQAGKLYLAKKYIEKAMDIVQSYTQVSMDKSNTFLNMCAVLSALGKHNEAINYAKQALSLAKEEMVEVTLNKEPEQIKKKVAVLAIAYENYAVEAEFLGNVNESVQFYKKAYEFLKKHDPENVEMIEKFKENFFSAKKLLIPKTRPSSAKSTVSEKSAKSFGTPQNFNGPSKHFPETIKSKRKIPKITSEKNFLVFKNQCQEFFNGNNELFRRNLGAETNKNLGARVSVKGKPPPRPEFKPVKAEIIFAPVKGVENVRKAVIREVVPGATQEVKNVVEVEPEIKAVHIKNRPSLISKRSSVSFIEWPESTPVIVQDFDEVPQKIPEKNLSPTIILPDSEPFQIQAKLEKNQNFLSIVCKIQARIRGMLTRERIKLLKSKPEILYRGAKKINKVRCFVTVLKRNGKVIAIINDGHEDQTILAPEGLTADEIFKRIDKNDKGIYFKKTENKQKPELLKSSKVRMDDDDYDVKYYYDLSSKTLSIKATRYSNSRVFSTERKNLAFNSKALIIRYINDEIQPNLCIQDQKLIIDKEKAVFERDLLAKGTRIIHKKNVFFTINKVVIEDGFSVEVQAECFSVNLNLTQVFTMNEILESLAFLKISDLSQDPHSVLLPLHLQENKIVLRKLDKNWLKSIFAQKEFFNINEYMVKVYKVQDDACTIFFQIHSKDCAMIPSYSITEKDLSDTFQIPIKKIKSSIKRIVKSIVLNNNKIQFNTKLMKSETSLAKEIMIVVKIQSMFRGHLIRDRVNFLVNRSPVIYSVSRTFEDNEVIFNFIRVNTSLLIEGLFADLQKSYYLFINKPELYFYKYSRLYDIKCIGNSIVFNMDTFVLPTLRGSLLFVPCQFLSTDEFSKSKDWPIVKLKLNTVSDFVLIFKKLKDDSVLTKGLRLLAEPVCIFKNFGKDEILKEEKIYSPEEFSAKVEIINGEILYVNDKKLKTDAKDSLGEKVIYRTIKRIDHKLYQVILSIENEETMIFSFKLGSESHSEQKIEIPLIKACEISGFAEGYTIPMADFIIKKMLVFDNEHICIVEPKEKFDMGKTLTLIQAAVRGYLQRKRLQKKIDFQILFKSFMKINKEQHKVLVFHAVEDYSLSIIKYPLILMAKLNKKMVKDNLNRLEKIFISKVITKLKIKENNGKMKIGGLKEWKKGSLLYVQVLESSRISSVVGSNISPRSILSPSPSEHSVKVLKWRSPRTLSDKNCIVSIYEMGDLGIIEVFILPTDQTFTLEVSASLIKDPELIAGQLEIKENKIVLKSDSLNIVLTDKRYISNKLAEITIFLNDKGYFATAFLTEEKKSLNVFLGLNVQPESIIKDLKIREVMGQDVLIISS